MSDIDASAMDRRSESIVARVADKVVEIPPAVQRNGVSPSRARKAKVRHGLADASKWPVDLGLLLMILLIGVPLLLYCILFPAG